MKITETVVWSDELCCFKEEDGQIVIRVHDRLTLSCVPHTSTAHNK